MSNYSQNRLSDDPNHVWAKLLDLIPEGSEVLDVGCSSGNFGEELHDKKSCVVDGVEPDAADAKIAATKLRTVWRFSIEDRKSIDQIKKRYDVIVFADVLEHLVDPVKALRDIKLLTKPGGFVVFSVPNMAHVSVRLGLLGGTFEYTEVGLLDRTHLHFYDANAVSALFSQAGMRLEKFDASSFEYSDRLIEKCLNELGFKPTPKGLALLHAADAAAFQYVGKAVYSNKKPSEKLKPTTQAVEKDVRRLTEELDSSQIVIRDLNRDLTNLRTHLDDISNQLNALVASKAYKLGNTLVKPVRVVKKGFVKKRGQ
ncbi:MAG TPA: class I SAM-dependent methyltransferase [Verrucomicrobiae bacterium]|nr:class I SAM-dependent methyltransferase [Verrucomicrobiae bacterium]